MGIVKSVRNTKSESGPPWWCPSGVYPAKGTKVDVSASEEGPLPIYTLTFTLSEKACGAPTPLDAPDVVLALDSNDEANITILYALIGKPYRDGNNVVWDSSGLLQWNGKTSEGCKLAGDVEVTIDAKAPNPKQKGDGYWPARYTVTDVSKPGENQGMADAAALALVSQQNVPGTDNPAPLPTPPGKGKRGR